MRFSDAIVRLPCLRISEGLTSSDLGLPDHGLALHQHGKYVDALISCGLNVRVLPADEDYPDSTFVEDTALLTRDFAVITNPGAASRKGEIKGMRKVLNSIFKDLACIEAPGTLEAGDVMRAGDHYFIGISDRTNMEGAVQLTCILNKYGMSASTVPISGMLHLKSGISFLEDNTMLAIKEFQGHRAFKGYEMITVPANEAYAANSLWINDTVIVPQGYPQTLNNIEKAGYRTISLDMSEFRKLDGGLSCLSLRF